MRRAATLPVVAALGWLLAACAGVPPSPRATTAIAAEEPFGVEGRLSARQGAQAVAVHFTWSHAAPRDELVVANPLGQTIAELDGDASIPRVRVSLADGRHEEDPDWSDLMARTVGFALPVEWLAAWIRGAPHAGAPHSIEPDAMGRAERLWQSGWEIVYSYPDEIARRPSRLRLAHSDVEVAIAVDRWRN